MQRCALPKCIPTLAMLLASSPALADLIYSENFEQETSLIQFWNSTTMTGYADPFGNFLGRFGNTTVRLEIDSAVTGGSGSNPNTQDNHVTPTDAHFEFNRPLPDGGNIMPHEGGTTGNTFPGLDLSESGNSIDDGLYHAGTYALTFDLYLFDSWDWSYEGFGPDGVAVAVNGVTLFDELFDVHYLPNNFRMPDELPGASAANTNWDDMIYRDIEILFSTEESMETFVFDFIGTPNQTLNDESWGIDNIRVSSVGRSEIIPAPGTAALLASGLATLGTRRRRQG